MTDAEPDPIRARLDDFVGKPLGSSAPAVSPDDVNLPMIRHWVDALDDRNPVYLDAQVARELGFDGIVAPPAMLQAWTMPRPQIEGIAARGGAPSDMSSDSPLSVLDEAGYVGTLATNSVLEFERYLRLGDHLQTTTMLESISEKKGTGIGVGYFVTWVTTYTNGTDEIVGRQTFRVLKFNPGSTLPDTGSAKPRKEPAPAPPTGEKLPPFDLDVTATVIVAGAIASRDFMPVHHDRDYAHGQGAPDIFMNILTTNGYVARFVTDWAGPAAVLRSISIRLGGPAVPGKMLRFTGQVASESEESGRRVVEVAINAANDLGNHATGTVALTLPLR